VINTVVSNVTVALGPRVYALEEIVHGCRCAWFIYFDDQSVWWRTMSATYVSIAGGTWAKHYLYLIPKRHSFLLGLVKTVAEMFDRNGRCTPYLIQIMADMGNKPSRGQVMRGINKAAQLGFWTVSNRHGGRGQPLTITANKWMEPFEPAPSKSAPGESFSKPEKSAPGESFSRKKDSSGAEKGLKESPAHTSTEGRKVHHTSCGGAAAEAAPPPAPEAGPAKVVEELVIKRKSPAEIATDDWNRVARQSKLVVASKPPYSLLNGKNGLLNHPGIAQDRAKWQQYFRYIANDLYLGGHDTGRAANLEQACRRMHIDRWWTESRPRPKPPEDVLQPIEADCDRPSRPAGVPDDFDPSTDPVCCAFEAAMAGKPPPRSYVEAR
jgi:hypothetical protein